MTERFNDFGAAYTDVLAMFPGASVNDFDSVSGAGDGATVVGTALGRISRDVVAAMPPEVYKQITTVDCEECVKYAGTGQTTALLTMTPILTGTVHLWQLPNTELFDPSRYPSYGAQGFYGIRDWFYRKPALGILEIDQTRYGVTVDLSTGVVANLPSLNLGDRIYASYDLDVANAEYALPSVADIVLYGTAAELSDKLFAQGTTAWKQVEDWQKRYADALTLIRDGKWIPEEIRKVPHWKPMERSSMEVSSVRTYRGG